MAVPGNGVDQGEMNGGENLQRNRKNDILGKVCFYKNRELFYKGVIRYDKNRNM